MQTSQKQEAAPVSSPSEGASSGLRGLEFTERESKNFLVEFAEDRGDIVYHFWPPVPSLEFLPGFAAFLEQGFKATLPPGSLVQADYTSQREAVIQHTHGVGLMVPRRLADLQNESPRETYYVRVVGGAGYPLADTFLKDRVFRNIEAAIEGA